MSDDAQEAPTEEAPANPEEVDLQAVIDKHLGPQEESAAEETQEQVETSSETPAEEGAPQTEQEPEKEQEGLSARQLAVLARKEQELREKEQKLKEQEGKLSQLEDLQKQFRSNPEKFLKEVLQVDNPADVATQLLYSELGDDAPEDFKKQMSERSAEARLRQMEERLEKVQTEAQQAAQRAQFEAKVQAVDEGIQGFLKSVPEDMRFLQHESQENPEETKQAFYNLAKTYIESGQFPTAEKIAKDLEDNMKAEYERLSKVFGGTTAPESKKTQQQPGQKAQDEAPSTLSDADTGARPDREAEELLSDEEYQARAIQFLKAQGLEG